MTTERYDAVILGTGNVSSSCLARLHGAGKKVLIIDRYDPGGTCSQRGCDPKKILMAAGELMDFKARMEKKGIAKGNLEIDWQALMAAKGEHTDTIPERTVQKFERMDVPYIQGTPSFTGPNSLEVNGRSIEADNIVIAVGARPRVLGIPGEEHCLFSDDFLKMPELPKSMIFIGGGYVSLEFACLVNALGCETTVVVRGDKFLREFDQDLVEHLLKGLEGKGMKLVKNAPPEKIEKGDDGRLTLHTGDGNTWTAEAIVQAAGRVPNLDDLNLEAGNVKYSNNGIVVDEYLQSVSNTNVCSGGDCADWTGARLTPLAGRAGRVIGENLTTGEKGKYVTHGNPSVCFTFPPLSSVGLREQDAKAAGLKYKVSHYEGENWFSYKRLGAQAVMTKVLIEEGTDRILGAHLLGLCAEELINMFSICMVNGLTAKQMKDVIKTYPTFTTYTAKMMS